MAKKLVSIGEICTALAGEGHKPFTRGTISRFASEGMPREDGRGLYDLEACIFWYLGRLRTVYLRRTAGEPGESLPSLGQAETRLKLAKAQAEEMTLAERQRDLMPADLHRTELLLIVKAARLEMSNLKRRLLPKLSGLTSLEIKAVLHGEFRKALFNLARSRSAASRCHTPAIRQKTPQ